MNKKCKDKETMNVTKISTIKKIIAHLYTETPNGIVFADKIGKRDSHLIKSYENVGNSTVAVAYDNDGVYFIVTGVTPSEQIELEDYYYRLCNPYVLNKDTIDFMATICIPVKDSGYKYIGTILQMYDDPTFPDGMKGVLEKLSHMYGQKTGNINSMIVTAIKNSMENMPNGLIKDHLSANVSKVTGYPTLSTYIITIIRAYQHYLNKKKEG